MHVFACVCVCLFVCLHKTCMCLHVCVCVCLYVCIRYARVCMCPRVLLGTRWSNRLSTHTYTHTHHIRRASSSSSVTGSFLTPIHVGANVLQTRASWLILRTWLQRATSAKNCRCVCRWLRMRTPRPHLRARLLWGAANSLWLVSKSYTCVCMYAQLLWGAANSLD